LDSIPLVKDRIWPLVYTLQNLIKMTGDDVLETVLDLGRKAMVKMRKTRSMAFLGSFPKPYRPRFGPIMIFQ